MPHALLVLEKDLRRFRLILLTWCGVLCLTQSVALLGGTVFSAQLMFRIILPLMLQWLAFLQAVLVCIFVPLVVQSDSLVGTTAFWLTRPISRVSLLRAKSLFVAGVFIVFPLLLELVVLVLNGLSWNAVLPAAFQIILEKSVLVLPVFLIASLTERFQKFVLAGLLAVSGAVVTWPLMSALVRGFLADGASSGWPTWESVWVQFLTPVSLPQKAWIVFASMLLIGHQYRTRRTGRTVLGIMAAVLLIPVVLGVVSSRALKEKTAAIAPPRVVIQTGKATVSEDRVPSNRLARDRIVSIPVDVQGLASGQFAVLRTVFNPVIIYGPDVKLRSGGSLPPSRVLISSRQLRSPIQFALKDFIVMNPYREVDNNYAILRLPESVYDQYQKRSGTYDGQGRFDVYAYQISVRLPLARGAQASFFGTESVILDIIEKPSGLTVIVGEKTVKASLAAAHEDSPFKDSSLDFTRTYVLVHPDYREAFLIDIVDQPGIRIDLGWPGEPDRLAFKVKRYDFSALNPGGAGSAGFKRAWLKQAELIRLDARKLGVFERELRFSGFALPEVSGAIK